MIQIILLIVGVFYFLKRPKLKHLSIAMFPDVTPEQFEEWKKTELASIDIFLWATWGLAIIGTIIAWMLTSANPEIGGLVMVSYIVLFLVGLTASSIKGSKAAKLKRSLGINWPPK